MKKRGVREGGEEEGKEGEGGEGRKGAIQPIVKVKVKGVGCLSGSWGSEDQGNKSLRWCVKKNNQPWGKHGSSCRSG